MLDKLSKNLLGLLLQYLEGHEIHKVEQVSRKLKANTNQDYIWRYLTENKLELVQKFYQDNWRQCFWRNNNAAQHMTSKNFRHQMCPIRHFKNLVSLVDSHGNFVFAADDKGNVGIFLINEKDLENDDETLQTETLQTDGVEYLKYLSYQSELIIVTKTAMIIVLQIQQTSHDKFLWSLKGQINLEIAPANLYVTQLGDKSAQFYISNLPLCGDSFTADQTVFIFNSQNMTIEYQQKLDLDDMAQDPFQQFQFGLQQRPWYYNFRQNQMMSLQHFKEVKQRYQLAVFISNQFLIFSHFSKKLIKIDTKMSKLDMFMKKTNVEVHEIFSDETHVALNLKLFKGFLLSHNSNDLRLINYTTMQVLHTINIGHSLLSLISTDEQNNQIRIIKKQVGLIQTTYVNIDLGKSQLYQEKEDSIRDDHEVNDMDISRQLLCCATTKGSIKIRNLRNIDQDPYFINAGSLTIKTYLPHPTRPGVSIVCADQSKIIAVLGNILRVYSFDIVRKRK